MSDPLLEVEDLEIQYRTADGPLTAVSNASFTIEEGEYFGLVGESGCGKSTIAKAVLGALDDNGAVTDGVIRYRGEEIQHMSERELNETIRWKEISYIPQGSMTSLDPLKRISRQAIEIAQTHTGMTEAEALDRFREMFDIVGLQESRIRDYPHQFSGGMQQRVIIALALFLDPAIIVADEPTTALDVIMQDQIFKYLDEIRTGTETSMLLITHDISLVFESCDSVAIMHSGQVAETGAIRDVYYDPRHPYSILLQGAFPDVRYPDRDLEIIDGHPPKTMGEVGYCTFVDRCPWAVEECGQSVPPLDDVPSHTDAGTPHLAACFRKDEVHRLYAAERRASDPTADAEVTERVD